MPSRHIDCEALLDSSAMVCFMEKEFAKEQGIPLVEKSNQATVEVVDGRPLTSGDVWYETRPIEVTLQEHVSRIAFNIIQSPSGSIVSGLPWLELHNLDIDWRVWRIEPQKVQKKKRRHNRPIYLGAKVFMRKAKKYPTFLIFAIPTDTSKTKIMEAFPCQYQDYRDVFEKKNADLLPKHRPFDCSVVNPCWLIHSSRLIHSSHN
ncbi:hypothetical protein L7F22_027789 [Adiantum nelumboides]|nr:hypothetical protein [Adiantum nelumboides]